MPKHLVMISKKSISKEWIEAIHKENKKADKILVEKVVRALSLLEQLAVKRLPFCFKGGTAAMLMLNSTRRLSIDIDIILPPDFETAEIMPEIGVAAGFLRCEPQPRHAETSITKEHYKFYYVSALSDKEEYILCDILKENLLYSTTVKTPIQSNFIENEGEVITVTTPDFNNILADKLTAFAPLTTGIPYIKKGEEKGIEIIKQLYDVGCLFEYADDIQEIATTFKRFAEVELGYKGDVHTVEDVLNDIINTSMSICLRKDYSDGCRFDILSRGISNVGGYIHSENFHLEKSFLHASKAMYLARMIQVGATEIERYDKNIDMREWTITAPFDTKLNKIKKTNPEAFFYLYKVSKL